MLLANTAWHGAENVYRYGLGVMSLPQQESEGHAHNHEVLDNGQSQTEIQDQGSPEQIGNKSVDHATGNHDSHSHQH